MLPGSVHTISLNDQPELWDRLHASSPDATLFSSSAWLTILARAFRRSALAAILDGGDAGVAGIPLITHRRGPLRLCSPLPITLYAGLLRSTKQPLALAPLMQEIERRFHFVSLSTRWSAVDSGELVARGWRLRAQQTIQLELGDKEALWHGYSQSLRRKLRRVPEEEFVLDTEPDTSQIVKLFEQSYSRHRLRPPLPVPIIEHWLNELRRNSIATCFAALHPDGRMAAARVVLKDKTTLYDWLAGADPSVAPSASHWLVHTILQRYSDEGCEIFDFMGANTPGVSDFKRSFGGTLAEYQEAEWYRPALLRHVNAARSRGMRLRRSMR